MKSRRFHFFKHPWVLRVNYRSADADLKRELQVGDTLNIQDEKGQTFLRIDYEGANLRVTQLQPVLSGKSEHWHRRADFAEAEQQGARAKWKSPLGRGL